MPPFFCLLFPPIRSIKLASPCGFDETRPTPSLPACRAMIAPTRSDIPSAVRELAWPAVANPREAPMFALAAQLVHSETADPAAVLDAQRAQLTPLLTSAQANIPFYRERLAPLTGKRQRINWERWQRVPLLQRTDIQRHYRALANPALPASHRPVHQISTSGSTGMPLKSVETALQRNWFGAMHIRKYRWHRLDYSRTICATRLLRETPGGKAWAESESNNWRPGVRTGPIHSMDVRAPVEVQADWLRRVQPAYYSTFPSNLAALIEHVEAGSLDFGFLEQAHTMGEVVDDELRRRCRDVLGAKLVDAYTSVEMGVVTLQAPDTDCHHVMSESHFVEVLKPDGTPCGPGEIGEVVVTLLHNFAIPLIRYATGDYAEVGESCGGPITLPVLQRVVGRTRNMWMKPDGSRFFPAFAAKVLLAAAPVQQIQLLQHSRSKIEARVIPGRAFTDHEERALVAALQHELNAPFEINVTYVERIERAASGKFEGFIRLADD